MNMEMKRNAEVTTIEITGRLDTTTAPVLDKTINEDTMKDSMKEYIH